MLPSILVGSLLTAVTVGIHAFGTAWWIAYLKWRAKAVAAGKMRRLVPLRLISASAMLLLCLHLLEVGVWALAYLLLPDLDPLNTLEEAVYFSMVTFTALGYGDLTIQGGWRLLSAVQAMNGLLIFGWSTALLFAVVERIWRAEAP